MPRGQQKKSQEDLEIGGLGHWMLPFDLALEKHDFVRFDLQLAGVATEWSSWLEDARR